MTAAVHRTGPTPSLAIPQTQNTAPVLEFNCLYTHDIRRKQKRWQDGFLRFHTFNKRVMVYDVPRNFIGDTHWKEQDPLQDGDELTLEKDGVLVQVAEHVGQTQTDLTELRKSAKKAPRDGASSSPVRAAQSPFVRVPNGLRNAEPPTTHMKHRSLNALLGTPQGPVGKAVVPTKSPFEQMRMGVENEGWEDGRVPKRQRTVQQPAWNATRTTKMAQLCVGNQQPRSGAHMPGTRPKRQSGSVPKQPPVTHEIIDLSEDVEEAERFLPGFSSDTLASPSSPPKTTFNEKSQRLDRSSSPTFQVNVARSKAPLRNGNDAPCHRGTLRSVQLDPSLGRETAMPPPLVHSNRGAAKRSPRKSPYVDLYEESACPEWAPNSGLLLGEAAKLSPSTKVRSGKVLRVAATSSKRKRLLCQDQTATTSSNIHSENTAAAISPVLGPMSRTDQNSKPSKSQRRQEIVAPVSMTGQEIPMSQSGAHPGDWMEELDALVERAPKPAPTHLDRANANRELRSQIVSDKSRLELAELDEMIMPADRPQEPVLANALKRTDRELRRVVSDSNQVLDPRDRRVPGAPIRYPQSPSKQARNPATREIDMTRPPSAVPPKLRGKKTMQRSVSLNIASNGASTVILGKQFQSPKPPSRKQIEPTREPAPWSREAFDLFDWRPSGWDEEKWCMDASEGAT